jgi:glycosyltransferase involved in cell wall biosynthesis
MRVCVVNPNFIRSSGVTRIIRSLHQLFSSLADIDIYYVSCEDWGEEADVAWISPSRLFRFNLMSNNPGELLREWVRFNRWAKGMSFDVVHSHHRRLCMLLKLSPALSRVRQVYTSHLYYSFSLPLYLLSPEIACAISPSVLANIKHTLRSQVMTFTGNPHVFPERPLVRDVLNLSQEVSAICVARLDVVKGHVHLIEAWGKLRARGGAAKLLLVGEGPLEGQLKKQVTALGLEDCVSFAGFRNDVADLMALSEFNLLVSSVEGLPNTVLEASTLGLPTLLTDVPGSRDCVPPDAALPNLVPFGDVGALADALSIWIKSTRALRQEEGMRFFRHLKKTYDARAVAERYLRAYGAPLEQVVIGQSL